MRSIVDTIYFHRHFWQRVKLSELSELYISLMLRALGMSLIGIFVPVYLYQQGFSIHTIFLAFSAMYLLRLLFDPFVAKLISLFGPKHIIRASYPMEIIHIVSVIAVGNNLWPLWTMVSLFAISTSMFMLAFHADFSMIGSNKHAGRELSAMTILEKLAGALGPLAGGLIATRYGFETAVFVALTITLLAAVPLYLTGEFNGHRAYRYKFSIASYKDLGQEAVPLIGRGFGLSIVSFIWPLLVVINVFSDSAYSGLGLITALGLGSTMLIAHLIGRLVDNHKGRELLRYGTWLSMFSHLLKPLINTVGGAIGINIAGESLDSMHRLPFMKGYYNSADTYKHGRVAYCVSSIAVMHVVRALCLALVALLAYFMNDVSALSFVTVIASLGTLLMLGEKFKTLN